LNKKSSVTLSLLNFVRKSGNIVILLAKIKRTISLNPYRGA
jgi:hypothetical protein